MDTQERDSDDDLGDYDYAETSSASNESLSSSSEEDKEDEENEDEQESGGSKEANKLQFQKRARKGRFLTNKKSKKAKKDQAWSFFGSLKDSVSVSLCDHSRLD